MKIKRLKKYLLLALVAIIGVFSLTACNAAEQFWVFGTVLEVKTEGSGGGKLCQSVDEYISSLEPILSPTKDGSDINKINASAVGAPVACQQDTMEIMKIAEQVYDESDGLYDPSIYPLVKLWKFDGASYNGDVIREKVPPSKSEIAAVLPLIGLKTAPKTGEYKAFSVDYANKTITKKIDGAMLDFGGIAKGYAVEKSLLKATGKQKMLVNLGGNIGGINKNYVIGIGHPRKSQVVFGTFTLESRDCVSTSGDYERFYANEYKDENGNNQTAIYHHILNPKTGYPGGIDPDTAQPYASDSDEALNNLISVSVISKNGALGDALSTAVILLGKEKGVEFLSRLNDKLGLNLNVKAILIDNSVQHVKVGEFDFVKK